jgi:hypothetical protein
MFVKVADDELLATVAAVEAAHGNISKVAPRSQPLQVHCASPYRDRGA